MLAIIKKFFRIIACFASIFSLIVPWIVKSKDITFTIDASQPGKIIGNKLSNTNTWSVDSLQTTLPENDEADIDFVEYIQIMQATGGNAARDLFDDPMDFDNLYDYNFTKLITACRNIVNFGAKPHIKTGNVPMKYSQTYTAAYGSFSVNVFPPDDYDVYYKYISAIAKALVDEFGRDEVLTWRFGVFTEFENDEWFYDDDRDPEKSLEAFCKIYDYTVDALEKNIGEDVFVGAHSMAVSEGLWDERDFIEHVAKGTNYKTGEKGTRICFLSASFYDTKPGVYNAFKDLPDTINHLRKKAESVGLTDLIYGIDEGRILFGNTSGSGNNNLHSRMCGYTYQAAYDARLLKQAVDNDIDYISAWFYSSGSLFTGYPTVSWHVADNFAKMADMKEVSVKRSGLLFQSYDKSLKKEKDISAVAAVNDDATSVSIMAYNFKNDLEYNDDRKTTFNINAPQFGNSNVEVTAYVVDDDANFFDEWLADKEKYNITDDCAEWSPDDPTLDSPRTINTQWVRELYNNELRETYRECAKLEPSTFDAQFVNGKLTLDCTLAANTVVFYEITAVQ